MKENHIVDLLESVLPGQLERGRVGDGQGSYGCLSRMPACLSGSSGFASAVAGTRVCHRRSSTLFPNQGHGRDPRAEAVSKAAWILERMAGCPPAGRFNGSVRDDAPGADLFQRPPSRQSNPRTWR